MLIHLLLIAESLLSFAFDLEKELQPKNQNGIYSPVSIATTLGMVGVGAKDKTFDEIKKSLHFQGSQEQLAESFKPLVTSLKEAKEQVQMETVLWMQKDFQFLPQYQSLVVNDFLGDLRAVDFSKPIDAIKEMNHWFFLKNGILLGPLFSQKEITPSTRLVAVFSTLYFKSAFAQPFDSTHTRVKPFHSPGKDLSIKMMYQKNPFRYYKGDGFSVVEMNYLPVDKELALWIILPDKEPQLLTKDQFQTIQSNLKSELIELEVPRFKLEGSLNLIPALQRLGVSDAFTAQANFGLMSEANNLMISEFKHRALILVEEAGTLRPKPPQPLSLTSKPFLQKRPFPFMLTAHSFSSS